MAYSYVIDRVDDLKKRLDFHFRVLKDGVEIGRDMCAIYAETFLNLSEAERASVVQKYVAEQAKKFQVGKDVVIGENAFQALVGVDAPMAEIAYPPVPEPDPNMNYVVLKDEITNDPLARGYAGMTDQQVADSLNTAYLVVQGSVPMRQVLRWAAQTDGINSLRVASGSGNKDKRRLADSALVMLSSPHVNEFDVADPEVAALLAGTVALGVLSQADVNALKARGQTTISRAKELGLPVVTSQHVDWARTH